MDREQAFGQRAFRVKHVSNSASSILHVVLEWHDFSEYSALRLY